MGVGRHAPRQVHVPDVGLGGLFEVGDCVDGDDFLAPLPDRKAWWGGRLLIGIRGGDFRREASSKYLQSRRARQRMQLDWRVVS